LQFPVFKAGRFKLFVILEVDDNTQPELDPTYDLFSFKEKIRLVSKRRGMPLVQININEHLQALNCEHMEDKISAYWVLKKGLRY
jgi:hypothetical protein